MYPKTKYIALLTWFLCLFGQSGFSQNDTVPGPSFDGKLPRPQLELGAGALTYFGDIGHLNGVGQTAQLNWGYHVALHNPISNAFGLDIFAQFGRMTYGERLRGADANFSTELRLGGIALTYNFDHFLPKKRNITPYLSMGITTFEFNSKADMYDQNGNQYHYWDDGSIRNLPQNHRDADEAILLTRDYSYETDLRAANGKERTQSLRSVSFPLGAGANIHVNDKFNLRLGAEYHFTLTDDIDGVAYNEGNGRSGNDRFLYTSLGISYNLQVKDKNTPKELKDYAGEDLLALEYNDEDGDGVADMIDLCPFTPDGVQVDLYGCPLDTDKDGVADHLDKEPNSAPGAFVNFDGVTLTDEEIEALYQAYLGNPGTHNFDRSKTSTADVQRNHLKIGSRSKGYRVEITNTSAMSNVEIAALLSVPGLKAEKSDTGNKYYIGDFDKMEDAMQSVLQLDKENIKTKLVYYKYGEISEVSLSKMEAAALGQIIEYENNTDEVTFRVQIGAFKQALSENIFKEVPGLITIEGNDGLIRYLSGSFNTIQAAAEHKVNLLLKGYEGAFVTAYKGGKRITLKEAGANVQKKEDITGSAPTGGINSDFVKYTIQLGSYTGRVPAEVLSEYMSLGNVRPMRSESGVTRYMYGSFNDIKDVNESMALLSEKGYVETVLMGEFNGQLISAEEAMKIKNH
jgi:hypothetical protein